MTAPAPCFGPTPTARARRCRSDWTERDLRVDRNLRSGGSWFTPEERAQIERKCGYAPEWDGFQANMSRGAFTCRGGRVVDDPEIRAVLKAASPRIEAGVGAVMARADVAAAIARVAEAAAASALRDVEIRRGR